jgi:hypothetical protein
MLKRAVILILFFVKGSRGLKQLEYLLLHASKEYDIKN